MTDCIVPKNGKICVHNVCRVPIFKTFFFIFLEKIWFAPVIGLLCVLVAISDLNKICDQGLISTF